MADVAVVPVTDADDDFTVAADDDDMVDVVSIPRNSARMHLSTACPIAQLSRRHDIKQIQWLNYSNRLEFFYYFGCLLTQNLFRCTAFTDLQLKVYLFFYF